MKANLVHGLGVSMLEVDSFIHILVLPLPSCVILCKLLDCSMAQFRYS